MSSYSNSFVEIRRARPLLGTIIDIRVVAPTAPQAERALRAAFGAVERVHALMSYHDSLSDVSGLNRRAASDSVRVHAWTHLVLRHAQKLHGVTHGLFDITIAPVLVRCGWLPGDTTPLPPPGGCSADITLLADHHVRFRRPLLIDLGGIAKGFAVDRAITALRRHGATAGVINAGGDLRIFGPTGEPVHVRRPESPGRLQLLTSLRNSALATSAPYFTARRINGHLCTPVIDPRNGTPSRRSLSVSVQARTCLLADALCKVVWLAGVDATASILQRHRARAWVYDTHQPMLTIPSHHAA